MAAEMYAKNSHKQSVWRGLHLRLAIQILLLAGFLPLTALAVYVMGATWYFFVAPYVLTWLMVRYQLNEWKCPGCQRSFLKHGQYGFTLPTSRLECVNCGLAVGEERNPDYSARASTAVRHR
jgi:hypothetical protein